MAEPTDSPKSPERPKKTEEPLSREEKLAKALRDNLRRRKAKKD